MNFFGPYNLFYKCEAEVLHLLKSELVKESAVDLPHLHIFRQQQLSVPA